MEARKSHPMNTLLYPHLNTPILGNILHYFLGVFIYRIPACCVRYWIGHIDGSQKIVFRISHEFDPDMFSDLPRGADRAYMRCPSCLLKFFESLYT